MSEIIERPTDHDINTILKLFNENTEIQYNPDQTISKIIITTKDSKGKQKTITIEFTYDANGNISNISKVVS